MSKAIFKQAELFTSRILSLLEVAYYLECNLKLPSENTRGFNLKTYGMTGFGTDFFRFRRLDKLYLSTVLSHTYDHTQLNSETGWLYIHPSNETIEINGLKIALQSTFSEDVDFQLELIFNKRELKAFYIASLLHENNFSGCVRMADTIIYTNMYNEIKRAGEERVAGRYRTGMRFTIYL